MPDVNVLVAAHRSDATHHEPAVAWLEAAMRSERHEHVGLSTAVLTGYVRVVTHRRVFREPTPLAAALRDVDRLRQADATVSVTPGPASGPSSPTSAATVPPTGT